MKVKKFEEFLNEDKVKVDDVHAQRIEDLNDSMKIFLEQITGNEWTIEEISTSSDLIFYLSHDRTILKYVKESIKKLTEAGILNFFEANENDFLDQGIISLYRIQELAKTPQFKKFLNDNRGKLRSKKFGI